jgi:hypothetical protein
VPFIKQLDAASKPKVLQYMTMPALQLFRWSAMLTVFVGFSTGRKFMSPPTRSAGVGAGSTIGLFLLIWVAASMILYFVISKTPADMSWARSRRYWSVPRAGCS